MSKKKFSFLLTSLIIIGSLLSACGNEDVKVTDEAEVASNQTVEVNLNPDNFMVVAHRGASGHVPEQTIPSYDLAIEMNADILEFDAQMTKDGVIVVFHDEAIDRNTNGEGALKDFTLEELKALDAGSWFNETYPEQANEDFVGLQIPTLAEVFERYAQEQLYYIETKSASLYPGIEEALVELIEEYGLENNVIIQSFEKDSLLKIKELNENIPLVQLVWYYPNESGELVEWTEVTAGTEELTATDFENIAEYAIGVGPNLYYEDEIQVLDEVFVQMALEQDLLVHPYTINNVEDMEKLIEWGVTGIFTDYPDMLNEIFDSNNK